MHQGAHPADALGEGPGVPGVAALQDDLDAADHGAGAVGAADGPLGVGLRLDPEVALDPGDRVHHHALGAH